MEALLTIIETIDVKRDYCPKVIVHNFINFERASGAGRREDGRRKRRGARRRKRRRRRGKEHHARRRRLELRPHASSAGSCSFAPSLVRSFVRPSVRGVIIMDASWGNAPFVDSFTVIIFLLACFAVNFGEHTRKEEETGEWGGEGGEERERCRRRRRPQNWRWRIEWADRPAKNENKYDVEQRLFPPSQHLGHFTRFCRNESI